MIGLKLKEVKKSREIHLHRFLLKFRHSSNKVSFLIIIFAKIFIMLDGVEQIQSQTF